MAQPDGHSQPSGGKRNYHRLSIACRRSALLSGRRGVIHVVTAAIHRGRRDKMNTEIEDGTGTAKSVAPSEPSKAHKKASTTRQHGHVAKKKGKPTKTAKSAR